MKPPRLAQTQTTMLPTDSNAAKAAGSNFIRNIIDADLAAHKFAPRR